MSSRSLCDCEKDFALEVIDPYNVVPMIECHDAFGSSSRSLKSSMMCDVHEDATVNEIKPEVLAMITSWKISNVQRQQVIESDTLMVDGSFDSGYSFELFEPHRRCTTMEPPRRFYRTFWRSISRRALQFEKKLIKSDLRKLCSLDY